MCWDDPHWTPPDADRQAAKLQADPRYRAVDLTKIQPERVHIELGPFRSSSALSDFIVLSGLWADTGWRSMACSGDLRGKAELWGLGLRFTGFRLRGSDVTASAQLQDRGIQIAQVELPAGAEALHVIDAGGAKIAPDVNLRLR